MIKILHFGKKTGLFKNLFFVILNVSNKDILSFLSRLIVYVSFSLLNIFIILLKKLNETVLRNFFMSVILKKWAFNQYQILLKYNRRNGVIDYTFGKQENSSSIQYSKFQIVLYTLMYIVDNFLNTTEQLIERFFVKLRRVFIRLVFKLPDSIYYIFFNAEFKRTKIPERVSLIGLYLVSKYVVSIVIYWADLIFFYLYVSLQNILTSLYERRKLIFVSAVLFLLFNILFKETASIIYEFFFSFFNLRNTIYVLNHENSLNSLMSDIEIQQLKYNVFFKCENRKFYGGSELYKIYYIFLSIKSEAIKNAEDYWKFFKAFSPFAFFKYNYYYFFTPRYKYISKVYWNPRKKRGYRKQKRNKVNITETEILNINKEFGKHAFIIDHYDDLEAKKNAGELQLVSLEEGFIWYAWFLDVYRPTKAHIEKSIDRDKPKYYYSYLFTTTFYLIYKILNKMLWILKTVFNYPISLIIKLVWFILSFFKK